VIVTDIDLPDAKYSAVVAGLRESFEQSSILVFSPIVDPVEVESILAAGAHGYLPETAGTPDLCTGIRTVGAGETYLHPEFGVTLARSRRASDATPGLSPQEERVLRLLVLGHTNADIARLCNISIRTAQTHRAHIQRKLDRSTRAELVEYARENGIVRIDPQ
jgi:two-component system, NarL family, response regulator NreC